MITDILIDRLEENIRIRTATQADKEDYIALMLRDSVFQKFEKIDVAKEIDLRSIIWNERYNNDCIMFAIVENISEKTIGFCEIENVSTDEPTIGITLFEDFHGKGYGYLAAKMMVEEGWKLFHHPYFIWEVEQDNIPSKKLAVKLGGRLINRRCILSEQMINIMREKGIEVKPEDFPNSVERYKIERPKV